jgi:hypothetical protein
MIVTQLLFNLIECLWVENTFKKKKLYADTGNRTNVVYEE